MYANLFVKTTTGRHVSAHEVVIERDRVVVKLDRNDGEGKYAEEGGTLIMYPGDGKITVTAAF